MKVTVDVKNAQATEETRRSDMVAEGMMEVHTPRKGLLIRRSMLLCCLLVILCNRGGKSKQILNDGRAAMIAWRKTLLWNLLPPCGYLYSQTS